MKLNELSLLCFIKKYVIIRLQKLILFLPTRLQVLTLFFYLYFCMYLKDITLLVIPVQVNIK